MKRVITGGILIACIVLAAVFLTHFPSGEKEKELVSQATEEAAPEKEADSFTTSALPAPGADSPVVGRKSYDIGVTYDRRVQTTEDGKHIVIEAVQIAETLHSPETSPEDDLDYLEQILSLYRLSFQRNPVAGDNQMVMEALLGSNTKNLVVFPATHPSLNSSGELIDRWGNPYFFHALSGTEMEIFSAGPDGELNTSDDIQRTARDGQPLTGAEEPDELDAEE